MRAFFSDKRGQAFVNHTKVSRPKNFARTIAVPICVTSPSLLFLLTAPAAIPAAAQATPSATDIMQRVAANQQRAETERAHYTYVQHTIVSSRHGNKALCTEITDSRITPGLADSHQQLLTLTGRLWSEQRTPANADPWPTFVAPLPAPTNPLQHVWVGATQMPHRSQDNLPPLQLWPEHRESTSNKEPLQNAKGPRQLPGPFTQERQQTLL